MTTELARRDQDAFELGKVFKASGMFPTARNEAEAVVKILAGREFGLGPLASMQGIHMVDGKPTLAANLIAGQIKRHQRYDYKVIRREPDGCELEFHEDGKPIGRMTWGKRDATAAGLLGKANWKKYPRDMYFARCLTAGARTFCPDVLGGSPVYTAEELGAEVSETPHAPARDHSSPFSESGPGGESLREPEPEEVVDAVVVSEPQTIDPDVLTQLRDTFTASGASNTDLAWWLLSVGVESLPENPDQQAIGAAMRGLNLEQAFKLEALMKGEDGTIPGSGETK